MHLDLLDPPLGRGSRTTHATWRRCETCCPDFAPGPAHPAHSDEQEEDYVATLSIPVVEGPVEMSVVSDQLAEAEPFTAIVDEHGPAVYRLAKSVVRDSALADDVAQETFIKVWRHLPQFRGEGSLKSWILRIAHNESVSSLRKIRDSATDPGRMPEAQEPIPTNRVVEGRMAASELIVALEDLDELSREIVVLREVEGFSYDEIADTLGVPIPTVKTRLLRARRTLARRLEDWRSEQ